MNEVLIRRKQVMLVPGITDVETKNPVSVALVASAIKNLEEYGYGLTKDFIQYLCNSTPDNVKDILLEVVDTIKVITGADKKYSVMYPNFPTQVMEASDAELFVNALIHYITLGTVMPEYNEEERIPLNKQVKNLIGHTTDRYVPVNLFKNIVTGSVAMSEQDFEDCSTIFEKIGSWPIFAAMDNINVEIPNKENLCKFVNIIGYDHLYILMKKFKTATDVLRLCTSWSDGDVSLAENTRFINFSRPQRRTIMELLANINNGSLLEDMFRYRERWLRVGEIIHPLSFKSKVYDSVKEAFTILREEKKPLFFGGKVEAAMNKIRDSKRTAEADELIVLLKQRPGEFARKLDAIIRIVDMEEAKKIANGFKEISTEISLPVLFQVMNHFENRNFIDDRVVIPKGMLSCATVLNNNLPRINERICHDICMSCEEAIKAILSQRESLGKVFYEEMDFCGFNAPFALRSASSGNKNLVRGSRIPVNTNAKTLRLFSWWTNTASGERIDIDLAAGFYDANWNMIRHISYTQLRSEELGCCHSGDITNGGEFGGEGVAEFIDINIDKVKKAGIKYVAFDVHCYTEENFSNYPCTFGWMERNDDTGNIFEPSTVEMNIKLVSETNACIPAVYDVENGEIIWTDLGLKRAVGVLNNIESSDGKTVVSAIVNLKKTTMDTIITLNIASRGERVYGKAEADIIFSNDRTKPVTEDGEPIDIPIITPFDLDYFVGELM